MPTRCTLPASVKLDANGNGTAEITARGDLQISHTRLTVGIAPGKTKVIKQPAAIIYLAGVQFESTNSGAGDQTDTPYELAAQETVRVVWVGGDPGATATMYLRGVWL